jgi:L-alanine-DL-glutamate epimerase-like enolase superfamily enzyme
VSETKAGYERQLEELYAEIGRLTTHVNFFKSGTLRGKCMLLEHRAVDILNVHGHISESLQAAWVASAYGIPVSVGNTPFALGVHIAAALPEDTRMEYSFQDYDHSVEQPIVFEDGYARAPAREGHRLTLFESARRELARPV